MLIRVDLEVTGVKVILTHQFVPKVSIIVRTQCGREVIKT